MRKTELSQKEGGKMSVNIKNLVLHVIYGLIAICTFFCLWHVAGKIIGAANSSDESGAADVVIVETVGEDAVSALR